MVRADSELQLSIIDELECQPSLDAARIGVSADHGVVTLTGRVENDASKWEAERAAKRVTGVLTVANEIEVEHLDRTTPDDPDICQRALGALDWNVCVPKGHVHVTSSNGWVTMDGEVEWFYQKRASEGAIRGLMGVRGITDNIVVKPRVRAAEVRDKIEAAMRRSAELDARNIVVEASTSRVILRGTVRSWAEHEDVLDAAWSAPGVTAVEDHLSIRP